MARKDASTLECWELTPTDRDTMGYQQRSFIDIARACDKWLHKRNVLAVSPYIIRKTKLNRKKPQK